MTGSDRLVAGAVLLTAAGLTILIVVLAVSSLDSLAISFADTTTPMALFLGFGLVACGVSTWLQPSTRMLAGILGFGFSLAALPGAILGGFLLGSVLEVLGAAAALAWAPTELPEPESRRTRDCSDPWLQRSRGKITANNIPQPLIVTNNSIGKVTD